MTIKTFDKCALPTVCFQSYTNGPKERIEINKQSDFEYYFIEQPDLREDDDWIKLAIEHKQLKEEVKWREKRLEQIREGLLGMSTAANSIGGGIRVERCVRKGAIKYSAIPELRGVDLDQYRDDPTEYYKIVEI